MTLLSAHAHCYLFTMHKASTRKAVPLSSHRKARIHIPYCYYGMKARGPAQPTPALEDEVALAAGLPRPRSFGGVGLQVLQPRTRFLAKRLLRSPGHAELCTGSLLGAHGASENLDAQGRVLAP